MSGHRTLTDVKEHYSHLRERFNDTTAAVIQRRVTELEVTSKALILSALALTLFIPALVTLSTLLPLGAHHGLAANWARHLGLSDQARQNVQQLLPQRTEPTSGTTVLTGVVTVLCAYGWPAELQRGYELIWHLPAAGFRARWRPIVWLIVFFGVVALVASSGAVAGGAAGGALVWLVGSPVAIAWLLWSQHLLLGARVAYRALLPGALVTTAALLVFSLVMPTYLSHTIVSDFNRYGPIGVVFALLSWMIAFSVVMLGGPLVGQAIHHRRSQ